MVYLKITIIFDPLRLEGIETSLHEHGIFGYTIQEARGRGRYSNSFSDGHLSERLIMEIYSMSSVEDELVKLLLEVAHVNAESEGLISVEEVKQLYWVHEQRSANEHDFNTALLKGKEE